MTQEASGYWRNVSLVLSGTVTAQMIPLLGSLIIARIFVPAEFGLFAAWLGMAASAAVFATCRFEMALALEPDGEPRATAAMATAITTLLTMAAVTMIGVPILWFFFPTVLSLPILLILLFIPTSLLLAYSQIWQAWSAAEGLFSALSVMRIIQAGSITGLQIGIGFLAPSAGTLGAGHCLGVAIGVMVMMWWLPPRKLPRGTIDTLHGFWSRYRKFPYFSLPADSINTFAAQLPLLIVGTRFGAEAAGFVALAFRTLGAPISLMGTAVLDVFKRRASVAWREKGQSRAEYLQTFWVLAAGSAVASLAFWFTGEQLFVVAFGETWRGAGQAAALLLPLFAFRFVASPLSYMFYIAEKQHIDLMWQVCLLTMTCSSLLLIPTYWNSLLTYALGYAFLYAVYLLLSYRFSLGNQPIR